MGITERKEREKQEMRGLVLEVATKMFIEDGYDKTSIRNIAEKIEYSPATIYLYFKDKDEIFYEIHNMGFEILMNEFKKTEIISDPFMRLKAVSKTYIDFCLKNPEYYDLMFIMRSPISKIEECGEWAQGECAFNYVLDLMEKCIENKQVKYTDKFIGTISVWSAMHGLVSLYVRNRFEIMNMPQEAVESMVFAAVDNFNEIMKA